MTTADLIKKITPSYNQYRKGKAKNSPIEQLVLMWKMGDVIKDFVRKEKVTPHTLYREIYGKSESTENVIQRSYITRELLSRSYRVRRMFKSQAELRNTFPNLSAINHFREAMPFFDNPKYKLDPGERAELIAEINSNHSNKEKEKYIERLQAEKIGKRNPRTQRLHELEKEKDLFINFYNLIFTTIQDESFSSARKKLNVPENDFLETLSRNWGAITADGLKMTEIEIPERINDQWKKFALLIQSFTSKESPVERRRFRRLVPPNRILRLSEMLHALTNEKSYNTFKS